MSSLFLPEEVFFVIRLAAFIIFLATLFFIFTGFKLELQEKEVDRTAVELAEALSDSNLTASKAVFKKSELDRFSGTNAEPYARHCNIGGNVIVTNLKTGERWSFGYEPYDVYTLAAESTEYPAAVAAGNSIEPATFTVKVYDTWLTRMTCLAENAYLAKRAESMDVSKAIGEQSAGGMTAPVFPALRRKGGDASSDSVCVFSIDTAGNKRDLKACRFLPGIPIHDFYSPKLPARGTELLKALPIKRGAALPRETNKCTDIPENAIASDNEDIGEIALCVQGMA